jgi:hypothetical protein
VSTRGSSMSGASSQRGRRRPRRDRASVSGVSSQITALVDARRQIHLSPPTLTSPYAVLRTRFTIPVTTNVGQHTVLLLGEHANDVGSAFPANICQYVAIQGLGTNVPGTTETRVADPMITQLLTTGSGSVGAYGRLHAMTVGVQCGSTAMTAEGFFYAGLMPGNIQRSTFATWNDLALAVLARRECQQYSADGSLTAPSLLASCPQDMVEWATNALFVGAAGDPSGSTRGTDTSFPLVVVWPPTPRDVAYSITVNCEWRVVYPMGDARASLHASHEAASPGLVRQATRVVMDAAGRIAGTVANNAIGAVAEHVSNQALGLGRSKNRRGWR